MKKDEIKVLEITGPDTHALRQKVLRPQQQVNEMAYPRDDASTTRHFGALYGDKIVGIASVYLESQNPEPTKHEWRLRGMAVDEGLQGRGVGQCLLRAALEHCRAKGAHRLWCNARTGAIPFYQRMGFKKQGAEFQIEGIGPHFIADYRFE